MQRASLMRALLSTHGEARKPDSGARVSDVTGGRPSSVQLPSQLVQTLHLAIATNCGPRASRQYPRTCSLYPPLVRSLHTHRRPPELCHNSAQPPECARSPVALRDLHQIEQCLRTNPFQFVIEVDFAAHALESEPPGVSRLCRGSFRRFLLAFSPETTALSPLDFPVV